MTPKSKERTALFPGSFDPFTKGHENIVLRTLALCDRVIIGVGVNVNKTDPDLDARLESIRKIFQGDPRVSVLAFTTLTGTFARDAGADFIVRGVRNLADFEYEINMADTNRNLFGIETVLLPALPELAWISSSTVRELRHFGTDPSLLLP